MKTLTYKSIGRSRLTTLILTTIFATGFAIQALATLAGPGVDVGAPQNKTTFSYSIPLIDVDERNCNPECVSCFGRLTRAREGVAFSVSSSAKPMRPWAALSQALREGWKSETSALYQKRDADGVTVGAARAYRRVKGERQPWETCLIDCH